MLRLARSSSIALLVGCVVVTGVAMTALREDAKAKAEVADVAKSIGKRMHFHESANFTWCTSVAPGRAKKFSAAAEKGYAIFTKHTGQDNWRTLWNNGSQKAMGVICANKRDYKKFLKWYAGKYPVWDKDQFVANHSRADWFTEPGTRNVFGTHFKPHDDKFVKAITAHLTGHILANRFAFNNNFMPAWIDESLAVYIEARVVGKQQCGCYQDPYGLGSGDKDRQEGLSISKLQSRAKKAILKGRAKNMKGIIQLSALSQLTFNDVLKGYAVVAWMFSQPQGFAKFLKAMKKHWPPEIKLEHTPGKGQAQERAFKDAFGLTLGGVDGAVKEYVQKEF